MRVVFSPLASLFQSCTGMPPNCSFECFACPRICETDASLRKQISAEDSTESSDIVAQQLTIHIVGLNLRNTAVFADERFITAPIINGLWMSVQKEERMRHPQQRRLYRASPAFPR